MTNTNATPTSQILQNYQPAPQGGAQASGASMPTAQSISQLQQLLQQMGKPGAGGAGQSPAMQLGNMGMQIAKQGQQPMPQMAPQMRPAGSPAAMQGPQTPQLGMNAQGMTPQMVTMALMRQNGLMG